MVDRDHDVTNAPMSRTWRRRGLMAGGGAVLAAAMAKLATPPTVQAADGQNFILGQANNASSPTVLQNTSAGNTTLWVQASTAFGAQPGTAIRGDANGNVALQAFCTGSHGITGQSDSFDGVNGSATANGNGVRGTSGSGTGGIFQLINPGQNAVRAEALNGGGVGVSGTANANFAVRGDGRGQTGVFGTSLFVPPSTNPQFGVWGQIPNQGVTGSSIGVLGENQGAGDGVRGQTTGGAGAGAGVHGINSGGGNAGLFDGAVQVNGNLTATGNLNVLGTKSAVVQVNGQFRQVFCQEAPSAWFEDFGEAQLVNGRVVVPIAPDYRATVATADPSRPYHVFLTSHSADIESIAVTQRNPDNFVVEANGKGRIDGSFSYRIVASRGDKPFARLPFAQPELPSDARVQNQLDSLPKVPAAQPATPIVVPDSKSPTSRR